MQAALPWLPSATSADDDSGPLQVADELVIALVYVGGSATASRPQLENLAPKPGGPQR
jgi:hypothetical protein